MKHAQSTSARELVQKIENHPNRHALQQDLRQMKTTPTTCHKKNTSSTGTIGGSISMSRAMTPNHCENVLILNKHCLHQKRLHQEAGGEQIEPVLYLKSKQWRLASNSSSTWCLVRFLVVCLRNLRKSRKMKQTKACD